MTKIADLRAKSSDELQDQLLQRKKEQFNLRFQAAGGQLGSPGRMRLVRRDIKTLQGGKSMAAKPITTTTAKPASSEAAPKKTAGKKK